MNVLSYCDGHHNLLEIADLIEKPFWELLPIVESLVKHGLLEQKYAEVEALWQTRKS